MYPLRLIRRSLRSSCAYLTPGLAVEYLSKRLVDGFSFDSSAQLSEHQQEDERQCHYDSKCDPVRFRAVFVHEIGDLDGEVPCHQADRHEQDGHFGKEDCDACQAFHGCRLFEGYEIEVLRMELANGSLSEGYAKAYQEYQ